MTQKIQQFTKILLISNIKELAINHRPLNIIMNKLDVSIGENPNSYTIAAISEMKISEYTDIIVTIAMVATNEYKAQIGINRSTLVHTR